jgi:CheY-like chemotaxis protein
MRNTGVTDPYIRHADFHLFTLTFTPQTRSMLQQIEHQVALPKSSFRRDNRQHHGSSPEPQTPDHPATVMVVDDIEGIRVVAQMFLEEAGFRVLTVSGGPECLELHAESPEPIDVIVLDYFMPQLDGAQTFAALKAREANVRVILSSGFLGNLRQAQLLQNGVSAILEKPYMPDQLVESVRSVLLAKGA